MDTDPATAGGTYRNQAVTFAAAGVADEPAVIAFLNALFPHAHYTAAWLAHKRQEAPAGPRAYTLARKVATGEVVGIYGLHPVPVRVGSLRGVAAECCNVGVHPLLWGTPLFEDLSRFALRADAARGHLFAFCSPRRQLAVKAHLKIGWSELARLRFYTKRPAGGAPPAGVREVAAFLLETPSTAALLGARADWLVKKDAAYLNWRYRDPCYRKFVAGDGATGLLVTKTYIDAASSTRRLHVMELAAVAPETETLLLETAEATAAGYDELHTWAEPESARAAALAGAGYAAAATDCPLLVHPHSPAAAAAVAATRARHVALGDDEAF